MSDVADRLDTLIRELTALGSPIGRYPRRARSAEDVRSVLDSLGLVPPPALIDLYAWHDGMEDEVFALVGLVSLDVAVSIAVEAREGALDFEGEDAEGFWRTPWFPIATAPASIFAIDCSAEETHEAGVIWRALRNPFETGIVAISLVDLVDAWISEIRAGGVYWHAESRSLQPREGDESRLQDAGLY